MECRFEVGQKVVCVADHPYQKNQAFTQPVIGNVYTVREVLVCPLEGVPGVRLEEITCPIHPMYGMEYGFHATRFRPVKTTKTDISIFTEIVKREFGVDKVVKPVKEVV